MYGARDNVSVCGASSARTQPADVDRTITKNVRMKRAAKVLLVREMFIDEVLLKKKASISRMKRVISSLFCYRCFLEQQFYTRVP